MHSQLAGEFQIIVKDSSGNIKTDTGFVRNLILNTGLDWFGNTQLKDSDRFHRVCLLGTGNSTPNNNQTKLDNAVMASTYVEPANIRSRYDFTYNVQTDGNTYKVCTNLDYVYTSDNKYVLTEIGLSSNYVDLTNYNVLTRALILDDNGSLKPINVNPGDSINVRYRLWTVFNIQPVGQTIRNISIEKRALGVGTINFGGFSGTKLRFYVRAGSGYLASLDGHLFGLNMDALQSTVLTDVAVTTPYVPGSYYLEYEYSTVTTTYGGGINAIEISCSNGGRWGIAFPYNGNDYYFYKDASNKLAIKFRYSWGRYEGALR